MADTTRQDLLVEAAAALGPDRRLADLDDDALTDAVTTGAAQLAAATARWLAVLAELVVRGVWARDGARSPAVWLSWACGIGASTAREHVRVALRLRDCPIVAERFEAGRLSYSKVRAITRVCTPEIEPMLVAWADAAPAAVLERIVADTRRVQRATESPIDRDDLGATSRWLDDGTYELRVRTDAATGVAIDQHLDRLVELADPTASDRAVDDGPRNDHVVDGRSLPDEPAASPPAAGPSEPDPREHVDAASSAEVEAPAPGPRPPSRAQRRADVVVDALAAAVAAGPDDTSGGDRHTVVLHVPADALTDELASDLRVGPRRHDDAPPGLGQVHGPAATDTSSSADVAHRRRKQETGCTPEAASDGSDAAPPPPGPTRALHGARARASTTDPTPVPTPVPTPLPTTDPNLDRGDGDLDIDLTTVDTSDDGGSVRGLIGETPTGVGRVASRRAAAALVRDGRGRVRAVSSRQLERLACAPRVLVTVRGDGTTADLGRTRREPDARLRRLLLARDLTCRFPGCGATQHLHAHHVVWWAHGGTTDLDNLVLLCRHHHAVVHDDGWRLQPDGRGRWTFHPPEGHPRADAGPWPAGVSSPGASAEAVALAAAVHAPDITPTSLRPPHWDGEQHDHDLAVGVLLERTATPGQR